MATLWVTAERLLPAWGFYEDPVPAAATRPLGAVAAACLSRRGCTLTWVVPIHDAGRYRLWVRLRGSPVAPRAMVDEEQLSSPQARGSEGYAWTPVGEAKLPAGNHHIDLHVASASVDALLLTSDRELDPGRDELPAQVPEAVARAPREYRVKVPLRDRSPAPLSAWPVRVQADDLDDLVPDGGVHRELEAWGAAGQFVSVGLAVRAPEEAAVTLTPSPLRSSDADVIPAEDIDVRVVLVRKGSCSLYSHTSERRFGSLLVHTDDGHDPRRGRQGAFGGAATATIHAGESRRFQVTLRVPATAAPGDYRGRITVSTATAPALDLPLALAVLPVKLRPVAGYHGIFYTGQPTDAQSASYLARASYDAALADIAAHGLNTVTLYGDASTLQDARAAGLTESPCLMHWPGSAADDEARLARQLGFAGVDYFGVDEPRQSGVDRMLVEADRRHRAGWRTLTAINDVGAFEALSRAVDRPVLNTYVFTVGDGAAALASAVSSGRSVVSYWPVRPAYPLHDRALTGLYDTMMGFDGSMPWAYQAAPADPSDSAALVLFDALGAPIPTLAWEAHRAGIDDVRYLQALDAAIEAARMRLLERADRDGRLGNALDQATEMRSRLAESTRGPWFLYLAQLEPDTLDTARRAMADAIVALDAAAR